MAQQHKVGRHATKITSNKNFVAVKYHKTRVFEWDKALGLVTLDSGGWDTVTTKNRINQALNQFLPKVDAYVYQENWQWYLRYNSHVYEFRDKMMINLITEEVVYDSFTEELVRELRPELEPKMTSVQILVIALTTLVEVNSEQTENS